MRVGRDEEPTGYTFGARIQRVGNGQLGEHPHFAVVRSARGYQRISLTGLAAMECEAMLGRYVTLEMRESRCVGVDQMAPYRRDTLRALMEAGDDAR